MHSRRIVIPAAPQHPAVRAHRWAAVVVRVRSVLQECPVHQGGTVVQEHPAGPVIPDHLVAMAFSYLVRRLNRHARNVLTVLLDSPDRLDLKDCPVLLESWVLPAVMGPLACLVQRALKAYKDLLACQVTRERQVNPEK